MSCLARCGETPSTWPTSRKDRTWSRRCRAARRASCAAYAWLRAACARKSAERSSSARTSAGSSTRTFTLNESGWTSSMIAMRSRATPSHPGRPRRGTPSASPPSLPELRFALMEDVLGSPLPDLSVPGDRDFHRSGPQDVVPGALDFLDGDTLPRGFLPDLPDELGPVHTSPASRRRRAGLATASRVASLALPMHGRRTSLSMGRSSMGRRACQMPPEG